MIKKRLKREDRIEQILDCTLNLIRIKSIDTIRTAEIAKEADISEGALFKYFSSKSEILERIMYRYLGTNHPIIPAEEIKTEAEFREFLDAYLTSMINITPERIAFLRLLLHISMEQHPLSFAKYDQTKSGIWSVMEDCIEYGKKHWGFRKDFNTSIQVRLFHLSLLMFTIEQEVFDVKRLETFDLEKVKETVINNLFRLLKENR